jgi:glycosyltransferase involved in cell wall biosynthesis
MVLPVDDDSDEPKPWAKRQAESLEELGVEIDTYLSRNRRSIGGLIKGGLAMRAQARAWHADFVHVHYGAAHALIAVLLSGKPVVISFNGSDILGNYNRAGQKTRSGLVSGILSQLAALGSRRCITKSEELKNALWFPWSRNKSEVIPNGVDLDVFQPMARSEARRVLGWSPDEPVVLFMDRKGAWVKDPDLAHAACAEARKTIPSLRMHIVESEPPERMPLFFNAADALLLTSRHEGSNNTVKEALACNLPVVTTACGDVRQRLAGVSDCHICPRDAHELGKRLAEVVVRRERTNGRTYVQDLSVDRVAVKVKQCYERAISKSGWPSFMRVVRWQ